MSPPAISVIIPAYNASNTLGLCLRSVLASDYKDFEVIVVDDHSTDDTRAIAQSMPCKLIELAENGGAAAARNCGAANAEGAILFFLDADITIEPGALQKILQTLRERPELAALFGSYRDETPVANFFSQYKNLVHHYTHQTSSPEAKTFASGFGAIRAEVFWSLNGFDPSRRFLEDIELGYRMHREGYHVMLDRHLQFMHHKRYTLSSLIRSDFFGRAIPWTRLMLEKRVFQNDLNTRSNNIISIPVSIMVLAAPLAFRYRWIGALSAIAAVAFCALNYDFLRFLFRKRGLRFTLAGALMTWFAYLYSGLGGLAGLIGYLRSGSGNTVTRDGRSRRRWDDFPT